jgi:hypothetical protein
MWEAIAGAFGGGGGAAAGGGGILGGITSALGAYKQNQYNMANAAQSRQFISDQSNSAHQREVKDLRAAGLNPILSGLGGSGASSGATAQAAPAPNVGDAAVAGATSSARAVADVQTAKATIRNLNAKSDQEETWGELFKQIKPYIPKAFEFISSSAATIGEKIAALTTALQNFKPSIPGAGIPAAIAESAKALVTPSSAQQAARDAEKASGTTTKSGRERGVDWRKRPMRPSSGE